MADPRAPHPDTPVPLPRDEDVQLRSGLAALRDLLDAARDLHAVHPENLAALVNALLTAGPPPR
jgi:hypothetical protein